MVQVLWSRPSMTTRMASHLGAERQQLAVKVGMKLQIAWTQLQLGGAGLRGQGLWSSLRATIGMT